MIDAVKYIQRHILFTAMFDMIAQRRICNVGFVNIDVQDVMIWKDTLFAITNVIKKRIKPDIYLLYKYVLNKRFFYTQPI